MLTADLVRVKKRKGILTPRWIDAADSEAIAQAQALIEAFAANEKMAKKVIDERVEALIGFGTDFLVWRGLAKLLYDRSEFETDAPVDPVDMRRAVFEAAAGHAPQTEQQRAALLAAAAQSLNLDAATVDRCLYSDLEERQILSEFDALESTELLNRYNLALAQAVLYRAVSLRIVLPDLDSMRLRYLFQVLKFNRLMHRMRRLEDGFEVVVDGPSSLFGKSRKYGFNMAVFLPALVLMDAWKLVAEVEWEKGRTFTMELDQDTGLVSHYTAKGQWIAEEERYFEKRFGETQPEWSLRREGRIHDLSDGEVLVTDYVITSPEGDDVFVEIVGFWRRAYIERRLDLLGSLDAPVVLVVAQRLKTSKEKLEAAGPVVFFKGVILADKVVEAAERVLAQK